MRLDRDLAALLALLLRWLDLVQSLQRALRTARALGDRRAEAWALHELGSLWLAGGEPAAGAKHLQKAMGIKEQLGDQGRCVSRHNLDAAKRDLADRASLERLHRRRLFAWSALRPRSCFSPAVESRSESQPTRTNRPSTHLR